MEKKSMELNKVYQGHALDVLKRMKPEIIDCVVTSPPYWGLRSYGTEPQVWDAKEGCELGLEPTFQLYLQHLFQIFDGVKRVLKPTGTCFVNLGDSYGGSMSGEIEDSKAAQHGTGTTSLKMQKPGAKLLQKSLIGIPERFAIGMTDRGWIRRNTIVWHKRNCMPSSITDRFTVDFEYVYFFVKQKKYYFKQQFEPNQYDGRKDTRFKGSIKYKDSGHTFHAQGHERWPHKEGRNMRCVWDVPTKPFKGAHFATFPTALVERMVKAGCPENGLVCDPFCGSGTVWLVSKQLNRNFVGIELKPDYVKLAEQRMKNEQP